ncbi:MAG TPA: hypothetical protein VKR83_01110 [Ktedonobacteraceae bacterium]|nr:hypothetical protein [Ktedonobacteraceae bacterium]
MDSEQAGTDQSIPLVEHVLEHAARQDGDQAEMPPLVIDQQDEAGVMAVPTDGETGPAPLVIWTPRFIILFVLTLVPGLSLESIFTQAWLVNWITGEWVFLGHIVLIGFCLILLLMVVSSRWILYGAIFGLIWTIFMAINLLIQDIPDMSKISILADVNVVTCLALLGFYICLSVDRLPSDRWDAWFLGLAPLIGVALLAPLFLLWSNRSLYGLENSIATVALMLSALVWWIRPSCWRAAPGPTFLFGVVPIILLLLNIANGGVNANNFFLAHVVLSTSVKFSNREASFFYSQVALLCILLGVMRLIKYEKDA